MSLHKLASLTYFCSDQGPDSGFILFLHWCSSIDFSEVISDLHHCKKNQNHMVGVLQANSSCIICIYGPVSGLDFMK